MNYDVIHRQMSNENQYGFHEYCNLPNLTYPMLHRQAGQDEHI